MPPVAQINIGSLSPNRALQPTPKAKSALGSLRCAPAQAELER